MTLNRNFKNTRKFDIEQAKSVDGTYQALLLFARNTKVVVIQQPKALKQGHMWLEYEDNGKPSGIADKRAEFFAINFDLKDRIYFMRADMLRWKARRYFKWGRTKMTNGIRYIKVPTTEIIRFD